MADKIRDTRNALLTTLGIMAALCLLWFGGYELLERAWLDEADPKTLHLLHILRGVGATVLVSAVLAAYFVQRGIAEIPGRADHVRASEEIQEQALWLIQLRWLAGIGVIGAILSARSLGVLTPGTYGFLWLGAGLLCVFNGLMELRWRRGGMPRSFLVLQLAWDSSLLTFLLHFSGGVENPFVLLYLFHAQVGAILLPRRETFGLAAWSALLFLALGLSELSGTLAHYPLLILPHTFHGICIALEPSFVAALSIALILVHSGTTFFTASVMSRLRKDQDRMLASERLSAAGRIVGLVAHEVNNPIGVITTKAHLALSRAHALENPDKMRKTMETILRQAQRVGQLVRSLLSVTYPSSARKEGIVMREILDDVAERLKNRFRACGVRWEADCPRDLRIREARFSEVVQIFTSLVINALEASSRGGIVRAAAARKGRWVEVVVSDAGEGIDPKDLPNIFRPFFTTKPASAGAGLDLALCKALVKAHDGEISVSSEPGRGSRFTVTLPAAAADQEEAL